MLRSGTQRDRVCLVAVAAPAEARAVLVGLGADAALADRHWQPIPTPAGVEVVVTGVGKACAAAGVARALDPNRHRAVVNLGICGSLGDDGPRIGGVVVGDSAVFADEGVEGDAGWQDIAALGFPSIPGGGMAIPTDESLVKALARWADIVGPIATVSTCSGTDERARVVRARTGAVAEAMEGAAVGVVAHRLGVGFGEVRVVSNTTGSRTRQVWDVRGALDRLSDVARGLREALGLRAGGAGEA